TQGDRIVIGISPVTALGGTAAGNLTVANRKDISGSIQVTAGDLAAAVAQAELFLGSTAGTLIGTPLAGAAMVTAAVRGRLQGPHVAADVEASSLQVGQLTGLALHSKADYTPERLRLDDTTIKWQNQTVNASGTIGLRGAAPQLDLTAAAQGLPV